MTKTSAGPIRLVLDTNIVVSGLLWGGTPRDLLRMGSERDEVGLFTSAALIVELQHTLSYRKFEKRLALAGMTIESTVALYRALCQFVEPGTVKKIVVRDPDDDIVVATAKSAKAHAIVSGDSDLLNLDRPGGITILRAAEAIELLQG